MHRDDEFYEDEEETTEKVVVQVKNISNGEIYPAEIVHRDGNAFWSIRFKPEKASNASALFKNVNGTMVAHFMEQDLQLIINYV